MLLWNHRWERDQHFLFFCQDKGKKYMEDTMAAVKLVSLTKEYRNGENYIRAVDDVSFSIKEESLLQSLVLPEAENQP